MKKKKVLIISGIVAVLLVIAGWAAVHFGISFVFDKYFLGTALSSIAGNDAESTAKPEQPKQEIAKPDQEKIQEQDRETVPATPAEPKRKLTNTEIINKVLRSSSLTNKMAAMVSYDDKKRVISIVLSNFTKEELAEIANNVKGGITSEYKSKMISEVSSRLAGNQLQECLNIAYKYIDQIRPYVE